GPRCWRRYRPAEAWRAAARPTLDEWSRARHDTGVEDFLARYGLLAVFAAAAFEGDVSVVLAGVLADLGFFSLPHAVEAAWRGGFVGDTAWYVLGRLNSAAVRR